MDLIKSSLSWLVQIKSGDEVRVALNRGLAYALLAFLFIDLFLAGFSAAQGQYEGVIVCLAMIPVIVISWILNRLGTVFGAFIITIAISIAAAYSVQFSEYSGKEVTVSVVLAAAPIIATRFISPWAGVWSLLFQLFLLMFTLIVRDTPNKDIIRYVTLATTELSAVTFAMIVSSHMLHSALRRSFAVRHDLEKVYDETLTGWSHALELRDKETKGHTDRVVDMTLRVAHEVGFSHGDLIHLKRGAILHDIGKMGIPDEILLKPNALTPIEWDIMKLHPVYAYRWLQSIDYLRQALEVPYCHHERWDGTGYPRGLRGKQIPLSARIFSIVDCWDALLSRRPYREPLPREEALQYLQDQAGILFDPDLVRIFLSVEQKVYEDSLWKE